MNGTIFEKRSADRIFSRHLSMAAVLLRSREGTSRGQLKNVSAGGLQVLVPGFEPILSQGEKVEGSVIGPGLESADYSGSVVWIKLQGNMGHLCGVRFEKLLKIPNWILAAEIADRWI